MNPTDMKEEKTLDSLKKELAVMEATYPNPEHKWSLQEIYNAIDQAASITSTETARRIRQEVIKNIGSLPIKHFSTVREAIDKCVAGMGEVV